MILQNFLCHALQHGLIRENTVTTPLQFLTLYSEFVLMEEFKLQYFSDSERPVYST